MRTFEEVKNDLDHATSTNDAEALLRYAAELDGIGTPQAEAPASDSRGWALYLRNDYPAALEHYHRALALHEEIGNRSGVAGVTGNIGNVHLNTGDYPAALEHYHRALTLHEELGERSGVAGKTCNIGIVLSRTGDYPAALSHFHRALALCEEVGNRRSAAKITGNIGIVHDSTGDYPTALEYFHRALATFEELGDRSGAAIVTGNIGNVHSNIGDYPVALSHFNGALALYEELGERSGVVYVTGSILAAYVNMGSDAEAQALLQVMDTMHIDDPEVRIDRELQRATLQQRSGELDGAAVTLQHALTEAQEHGLRSLAASTHKSLRDLALTQSNLAAYVEHNNEYTRITEEINGKEATLKMAMQAKQREIDAREREHAQHMAVLHSTLPKHIADRVARGETVNDAFDNAAVLFIDVVGFTTHSSELNASQVVDLLQDIFTSFDAICAEHNVMKIKTIGDSYMAVAFPEAENAHMRNAASVALAMMSSAFFWQQNNERVLFRIGIHSGPVVAGVLGTERMQYDVWGDTVNVASRMESTSEPGRIHISEALATALNGSTTVALTLRGETEVKGKGTMQTYWLEGAS